MKNINGILLLCVVFFCVQSGYVHEYQAQYNDLKALADSIIQKEDDVFTRSAQEGEQIQYKNVQQFVSAAKEEGNITDQQLAQFLADYAGVIDEADVVTMPQERLLTILLADVISAGTVYYKVPKNGEAAPISKEELDFALVQKTNNAKGKNLFPDGYMGITTWVWKLANTPNGGRVYQATGIARWYKKPNCFFRDAMAINATALYYNPVDQGGVGGYPEKRPDFGSYGVYTRCTHFKCQDDQYGDKRYNCDVFGTNVSGDNELVYPGMTGIGYTFRTESLTHFTMAGPDMAVFHDMENWKATAILSTDIYVSEGESLRVQAAYGYHLLSLSSTIEVGLSF